MLSLVTFFAFMPVNDPAGDKTEKLIAEEMKKLQGIWKVVKGEPMEREIPEDYRVIFKDGKVTFGKGTPCKIKLDPSKEPKWFDIDIAPLFEKNPKEELYEPGIYKLDGDKLILAIVNERTSEGFRPRPKDFEEKFYGQRLHLERVKK